jgi:hypothetical protein
VLVAAVAACAEETPPVGTGTMSFFVTSTRTGTGGNLGGLDGADAHCLRLAAAAGSTKAEWRAYLSADADGDRRAIDARTRIGNGPWFNANGVQIAASVPDLHAANLIGRNTALTELKQPVSAGIHDILTGSNEDGTLAPGATCRAWTSPASGDATMVGHFDKRGGGVRPQSWNSAHATRGCALPAIQSTGGDARFYCFAAD